MKHAIKYLTVILAIFTVNVAVAQTGAQKRADKLYGQNLYKEASVLYEHVVKKDANNKDAFVSLGNCYRKLGMLTKAEDAYSKAAALGSLSSEANFFYGTVLAANGKADEAKKFFELYNPNYGAGFNTNTLYADSSLWKVWGTNINTWGSDMGPAWYKKGIVYSSARKSNCIFRRTDGSNNGAYYDIFVVGDTNNIKKTDAEYLKSVNKKGKKLARYTPNDDDTYNTSNDTRTVGYYGSPYLYDSLKYDRAALKSIPKMKGINKKFNDGPVVFYNGGDSLIFTRTSTKKSKATKSNLLGLYSAKYDGEKVSDVKALSLNSKDYNVGHPALSPDNKTLYFSSDMPGGQGGKDLYMSKWEGGAWSTPVNLGPSINTPGDEVFPFVNGSGQLFFASNGLPGLGGLDNFVAWPEGNGFGKPENLGYPANSNGDDFGYISDKDNKNGYFSSNRLRGGVNDDIYKFYHIISIKLDGLVVEEGSETPINLAQVELTPLPAGQTQASTKEDGKFKYYMEPKQDYSLKVTRDGYDDVTIEIPTKDLKPGSTLSKKIVMNRYKFLVDGSVSTRSTNEPVEGATVYIKNKTTGQTITATTNAAGVFDYKLEPESDYIIFAEKNGLFTDTTKVSTMGLKKSQGFKVNLAFDKLMMLAVIYYDYDKSDYRKDEFNSKEIDELASLMKADPTLKVLAKSFADSRGETDYNDKLSAKRSATAISTLKAALKKRGMKEKELKGRLREQHFGETNLTNKCADGVECTEEEHQKNRRTEFVRDEEVAPASK